MQQSTIPDWDVSASKAANAGLTNTNIFAALMNIFVSPELPGGIMSGDMGVDIGDGVFRSARSPQKLLEAPEEG